MRPTTVLPRRADVRASRAPSSGQRVRLGGGARFAQYDIKPFGDWLLLVRPAYGTGNVNLFATRDGVFAADANAVLPRDVFPQVRLTDPRGPAYRERLYPRFLTDAHGEIVVEEGCIVLFYSSGRGFKDAAYTWDLFRAEVPIDKLQAVR